MQTLAPPFLFRPDVRPASARFIGGSISFYENGSRTPDIETLDRLHAFFNVSVNYLMGYASAGKEENVAIGEELGLSDKAIEVLRKDNKTESPVKSL